MQLNQYEDNKDKLIIMNCKLNNKLNIIVYKFQYKNQTIILNFVNNFRQEQLKILIKEQIVINPQINIINVFIH